MCAITKNHGDRKCCVFSTSFQVNLWLTLLLSAYLCLGAYIFMVIESPSETSLEQIAMDRSSAQKELIMSLMNITRCSYTNETANNTELTAAIQKYEDFVIETSNAATDRAWDFTTGFYLCVTTVTTIGYGNVAPTTQIGRILIVFYSIIGVPLNLLFLSNFGIVVASFTMARFRKVKKAMRKTSKKLSRKMNTRSHVITETGATNEKQETWRDNWQFRYSGESHFGDNRDDVTTDDVITDDDIPTYDELHPTPIANGFAVPINERPPHVNDGGTNTGVDDKDHSRTNGCISGLYQNALNDKEKKEMNGKPALSDKEKECQIVMNSVTIHKPNGIVKTKETKPVIANGVVRNITSDASPVDDDCPAYSNFAYDGELAENSNDNTIWSTQIEESEIKLANGSCRQPGNCDMNTSSVYPECNGAVPLKDLTQGHTDTAYVAMDNHETIEQHQHRDERKRPRVISREVSFPDLYESDRKEQTENVAMATKTQDDAAKGKALWTLTSIYISYTILGAVFFYFTEYGWTFIDSLYCTFISLATIGFGDLIPGHQSRLHDYGALRTVIYLLFTYIGLIIFSACFSLSLEKIRHISRKVKRKLHITGDGSCCCRRSHGNKKEQDKCQTD